MSRNIAYAWRQDRTAFAVPKLGEAIDLLPLIDPAEHAIDGRWLKGDGSLTTPCGPTQSLTLPVIPGTAYRIDVDAQRVEGTDSISFGLIQGDNYGRVLFEGYEDKKLSGLIRIDGKDPIDRPGTYAKPVFTNGKTVKLVIEVHLGNVRATADGETVVDWKGKFESLNDPAMLKRQKNTPKCLTLNSNNSSYRISKLTYTALPDVAEPKK